MVHWWPLFAGQVWPGRSYAITNVRGVGGKQKEGFIFLHFFSFLFSFLSVVLLLQSLAFIRWLRKATDQDRSGGARKRWKTPCAFSPIFGPLSPWMLFFDAQCQDRRGASHSSVIVRGHTKLLSSTLVKVRSVVRTGKDENISFELEVIGTYSVFSFQADTSLTWKNEDTWISKRFEMVVLQGKTHSCLQGDWVPDQIHRNSIEILF